MMLRAPLVLIVALGLLSAGTVPASAGVASARTGCTRIPGVVAAAKVPAEVKAWSSGPVIGGGSIWALRDNLAPRVRPERDPAGGSYRAKFPWYLIPARGDVPRIRGRRVDGPGTFRSDVGPADFFGPGTGFAVSILVFSTAGCWEVTGAYHGSKLTFRLRVGAPARGAAGASRLRSLVGTT